MILKGVHIKYFLIGIIFLIPSGVFCQVKIFTTDSLNLKEWNYNQRKIVRNPGIGIIAESKNEIFFSYNFEDPEKILDGKNASLAVGNDSVIYVMYENNGIKYLTLQDPTDLQSKIQYVDIAETGFSPVADCDKDGNIHLLYGAQDPANILDRKMNSLNYVKISGNQKQISSVIYDSKIADKQHNLVNYAIATDLLFRDKTIFLAYQLSNDSIYIKYSVDYGENWKLSIAFPGTNPSLSVGFFKDPAEPYSSFPEDFTCPAVLYMDSGGNLLNRYAEYFTGAEDVFHWYDSRKIQDGPVDYACMDDLIIPEPFGYSNIFQKEGVLYHAFSDMNENRIMDTITNNVIVSSIAYKQFNLYQVDIVWYEKKDDSYILYYQGFGKLSPALSLKLTHTQSPVVCYGESDGFIYTTVTGGIPPYHYFWSTGDHTEDLLNIPAGYYELTVSDMNSSCIYASFEIPESLPVETGDIEGPVQVNKNEIAVYSVPATQGSDYNWKVYGGILMDGQGNNSVNVQWGEAGSGKVSVIETNKDGCKGDKVSLDVSILQTRVNPSETQFFSIYPNPFTDNTKIQFPNPESEPYQLIIRDLSGKTLKVIHSVNKDMIVLQRDGLPSGLYLLELKGPRIYRARIVIY